MIDRGTFSSTRKFGGYWPTRLQNADYQSSKKINTTTYVLSNEPKMNNIR